MVLLFVNDILLTTVNIGVVLYQANDAPTPLILAAKSGDINRVVALLGAGARVDEQPGTHWCLGLCVLWCAHVSKEEIGQTALIAAVDSKSIAAVSTLLAAGANIDLSDGNGRDALDHAIGNNFTNKLAREIFWEILTKHGGVLSDSAAQLALMYGAQYGAVDIVTAMVARVHERSAFVSAMCAAIHAGSLGTLDILRSTGGSIPLAGFQCLRVDQNTSFRMLKYLIEHGMDPNYRDPAGSTIVARLVLSMQPTYMESQPCEQLALIGAVQLLLSHGANPNLGDGNAPSAIQQAQRLNMPDILELLQTGKIRLHGPGQQSHTYDQKSFRCTWDTPTLDNSMS